MKETTVTLTSEDGTEYEITLLDVFDFEAREYALLYAPNDDLVVMRLEPRGEEAVFSVIDDDDEFRRVCGHIHQVAELAAELPLLRRPET